MISHWTTMIHIHQNDPDQSFQSDGQYCNYVNAVTASDLFLIWTIGN
jgi:hypothetical protein